MSLDINEAKEKFEQALDFLAEELKKLRTGRANAAMLDAVTVEVYGQQMPLPHMSTITALDARTLQISPYDPNNLDAISTAIRDDAALGLNPSDDGRVVRVSVGAMTTERRQEVVRQLHEKVEETNISFRNIRHEVLNTAKTRMKDKEISEDDYARLEKQINDLMDEYKEKLDTMASNKEADIMTV